MRIRKNKNPSSILSATVGYDGERPEKYVCQLNQSPCDVIPIISSGDFKFTNPNLLLPSSSSDSPPTIHQSCSKTIFVSPENASDCLRIAKEDSTPSEKEPEAEVENSKLIVSVIDNTLEDSMPSRKEPVEAEVEKSKLMVSVMDNVLQDSMPSRKEPEAEVENSKLKVSVINNALEDSIPTEKKSPTAKEKENPNILKIYKRRSPHVTNGGDVIVSVIDSMPSENKSPKAKEKKKPIVLKTYKRRIGGDVKSPEAKEKSKAKVAEDSTSGEAEICLSYAPGTEETENLCLKNKAKVAEDSTSGEAEICLNYTPGETENLSSKDKAKVAEASTSGEAEIWLSYPPATEETENLRSTNKAKVVEASSSVDAEICLSYAPATRETENLCLKTKANVAEASTSGEAEICLSDPPAIGEAENLCLIPMEDVQSKHTKISTGSLPIRLFTRGTEPAFKTSFTYRSGLEKLPVLSDLIPSEELDDIRNGVLGVLLRFYENGFTWSAKLVHELRVHQLAIDKKHELWTLCGAQPVRFSLKEFEVITGLNCEPFPRESVAVEQDPEFWGRLGLVDNKQLSFTRIEEKLMDCENWSSRDRIRLVHLFLICRFLLARHPNSGISRKLTSLVLDREKFEAYPWGRVGFEYLIESVKKVNPDLANFSYCVDGFVQILQVWAYEAIPAIGNKHGGLKKDMMEFPPLLRWKGSRKRCKLDLLMNAEPVFVNYVLGDITEELWDNEEDLKVNNMLSMISATSGKVFKKHHWENKGLFDGPNRKAKERNDQRDTGISLKKKRKSKDSWDKVNDASETLLGSSMENLQKHDPNFVEDLDLWMEMKTDIATLTACCLRLLDDIAYCSRLLGETGSQTEKEATCSNIRGGKKSKRVKNLLV